MFFSRLVIAAVAAAGVHAQSTVCAEANEHYTATLSCPGGERISSITFASYGMPNGGCGSYSIGWCHAGNSLTTVQAQCVGATSCNIYASNSVFGDPCFGTYKHAFFSATCSVTCNPPGAPNSYYANVGGYTWRWYCNAGYYGSNVDRVCNLDGSWSGNAITCTPCPAGSYCPGAGPAIYPCAAGYYGGSQALSSASCSGCCAAGYRCAAGSTSPTQYRCGGSGELYCPACSSSATGVSGGFRTTPVNGAVDLRSGQEPCPSDYSCTNGVTDPAIMLTGACAAGTCEGTVSEQQSFLSIPPSISVSTPGYSGGVAWSITAIDAVNPSCNPSASPIDLFVDPLTQRSAQIYVRASLPFASCYSGFAVTVRASRTSTGEAVTARVTISVTQRILPPVIAECNARSVLERQPAGTNVGPRLSASTVNTGTALRWSMSPSSPYVQIDSCTGQITTLQVLRYATWQGATFTVTVTNDGSALGLGSQSSTCNLQISVTAINDPPVIVTTNLMVTELTPAGTIVGRIQATDPNGDALSGWAWASRDPRDPNAFAINAATGDVTVTKVLDTTVTLTTLYSYVVSVSDGRLTTTGAIDISIQVVYRPPVVADNQIRSISEAAAGGTTMPPALSASHPQRLALSYFIDDPSSTFSVDVNTGVMFLLVGRTLNYQVRTSYNVVLRVRDSQGGQAQTIVTVNVLEVNKPPYFAGGTSIFNVDANPGSRSGSSLLVTLTARDDNIADKLTYVLTASDPPVGLSTFSIDPLTGRLQYAAGLPNGTYAHNWAVTYPRPATFLLSFSVLDSGVPRMSVNGTIEVLSYGVAPLVLPQTFVLPANARAGTVVASVVARSAYSQANLGFSLISCDRTPSNQATFALNAAGVLSVASPQPTWDFNVQPAVSCTVSVSDSAPHTGVSSAVVTVQLSHVNRPPAWRTIATLYASSARSGNIGQPLSAFVDDPDTRLSVGERLTFAIVGGNTDATMGIDAATGQIFVADNATAAIQYNGGANSFSLQVNVTDAGVDGPRYWAVTTIRIDVVYANNPPGPLIGPFRFAVTEHMPAGTVIGYFDATDFDANDKLTYAITPAGANVNQPFALNVSTVSGGPFGRNRGVITVIDDGWWPEAGVTYRRPMDWNLKFRRYEATITVTDITMTPLSASAGIIVDVDLASEPPYFNADTRIAGSGVFNVSTPEHSAPGTVIAGAGALAARHKDPWQMPNLQYAIDVVSPGCPATSLAGVPYASIFAVNAMTAALSLVAGAPDLTFNAQPLFRVCLRATDNMSRSDVATVNVAIADVNDPAVWRGVSTDAAGSVLVASLNVAELAPVGTIIGYLQATDVDRSARWGARKYSLVSTPDARFFAVDADSGAVSVGLAGIDAWDQPRFLLNVTVQDTDPLAPIIVPFAFSVNVVQANRLAISGIAVPPGTAAATAVNVSTSPYAATHAGMGVLLTARGGAPVWLSGAFLGPSLRRLVNEGRTLADIAVRATYGPTGVEYAATGCSVVQANSLIGCTGTAEGVGISHVWNVSLSYAGGPWWWAPVAASVMSGYLPPRVLSVVKTGAASTFAANQVATTGGDTVDVACDDCGPFVSSNRVTLDYGRRAGEYAAAGPCTWVTSQSLVRCTLSPGIGGPSLLWRLTVGSQTSWAFNNSLVHYAPPAITTVAAATANGLLTTAGGDVDGIVLTGSSFGPAGTTDIVVEYSMNVSNPAYTIYTAVSCRSTSHTRIVCTSAPGVGRALRVRVTVGGQTSLLTSSGQTLAYTPPAITGISGLGAMNADTVGGQTVILAGRNFGPATQLNSFGRAVSAVMAPSAFYGRPELAPNLPYAAANCFVSVADMQAICTTVEGVGAGLVWRIVLGEQSSPVFVNQTTSYHPPIVASYSGGYMTDVGRLQTYGGEIVFINGRHFGPLGTPIDNAYYSAANGTVFTAENCSVIRAHDLVQCNSVVGAGAGLLWRLTIGRQISVAPTTAYGVPVIDAIAGPGASDASTDGGDLVILTGRYFSIHRFLESVTYGASGTEYTAADCRVTVDHTEIRCFTVPGTGRKLVWVVRVQGQTSAPSDATTSYEAPVITAVTPLAGLTDGAYRVLLSGTGFALAYKAAVARVRWNALGSPQPSGASIAAHYASIYAGGPGDAAAGKWIAELPVLQPIKANRSLEITVPEGFGAAREVILVVDGVPSNIASFTYVPPVITNVAPDRQNVTRGNLRVVIEGSSFCSGKPTPELPDGCGFVTINGVRRTARKWSHSMLEVEMEDLTQVLRGQKVPAVITVNGVDSNAFYFLRPVPSIDKLIAQGSYGSVSTQGGDRVQVRGVQNLVGERYEDIKMLVKTYGGFAMCTNITMWVDNRLPSTDPDATYTLECSSPAGVGADCPIIVSSIGGNSTESEAVRISYAKPSVGAVWLSAPFYNAAERAAALALSSAERAALAMLPGSPGLPRPPTEQDLAGAGGSGPARRALATAHEAQNLLGSRGSETRAGAALLSPSLRRRLAISMGVSTLGAQLLLDGSDFGLPEHDPAPMLTIVNGLPLRLQWQNHTRIMAVIPPGDGAGYALRFTVGVQDSNAIPFSYAAPTVFRALPPTGPSTGGLRLTLRGANFGVSLPDVRVGNRSCALTSDMFAGPPSGNGAAMGVFIPSVNHSLITCTLPPGQGKDLPITVTVNGQTSTLPAATFSYLPPEVFTVAPTNGPTSGRTRGTYIDDARVFTRPGDRIVMVLTGKNLGRWGTISFEPTPASGPGSEPIAVAPTEVLPLAALRALLARASVAAGGAAVDVAALAGMNVSDVDLASWERQAALDANATRAAGGTAGVSWSTDAAFRDVDRAWNDTTVVFLMPAGFGDFLRVNVTAGQPGYSAAMFTYDPPIVTKVIHRDYDNVLLKGCVPAWENATVHPDAAKRGVQPRMKKVWPPCYPTAGNFVVIVIGEGFGPPRTGASSSRPTLVLFGNRVCAQMEATKTVNYYDDQRRVAAFDVTPDHNHLFCLAPPGIGVDIPVVVSVAGRVSPVTNTSRFSYDPPAIDYFTPSNPDAMVSGARLGITGRNYGDDEPRDINAAEETRLPVGRVLVNELECERPLWITARYIACKSASDVVGAKNVTLYLDSNATGYAQPPEPALVYDVEEKLVYTCTKDFYGLEGEKCMPCPQGGICPGSERFYDLLTAAQGFWRFNATVGSEVADLFCDDERKLVQIPARGGACPALRPCEPPEACLAGNLCSLGYEGERCAFCLAGKYYRVNGECVKCPDNIILLYVGLAVVVMLFGSFAYFLNKKNVSLALIAIGVDYFQIVSLFARARIRWPDELKFLLNILSVFNLNIEIVAPECLSASITYGQKWAFIELLPLTLMALFLIIHLIKMLYKVACTSKTGRKQLMAHLPTLVSTLIVVFRVLYLYLTKTSMDALSCLTTTPPEFRDKAKTDAITYMAGQLDYPCWVKGSYQLVFFPLGLFGLSLYSIAVPAAAFWWLRRNRDAVKTDQILRCKDTGHDELTNPHYYRFRKMWSKLYLHYKPGKWYWEIVIIMRKFLFALTGLMFRQVGAYQLSMALLVLFLAFVLHTQHLPYLTHGNKETVVQEHLAKAVAGDPLHASIEADMKEVEKKNTRKRQRLNVFQSIVAARKQDKNVAAYLVLGIFNANTVEAILLASAILVNLSGVMFDSARFAGDNYLVNKQEYKALAYAAVLLIASTIVYYLICLLLELMVAFCPRRIGGVVSCVTCCCRAATRRKMKEAELKARSNRNLMPRMSRMSLAGGLQVNPFMVKQQQAAAAALASGDASGGEALLDEILSMDAPSGAAWKAVQAGYKSMSDTMRDLQAEVRMLKRDAASGAGAPGMNTSGGASGGGSAGSAMRTRTQFKPMLRGGDDGDELASHTAASMMSVSASASASASAAGGTGGGSGARRPSLSGVEMTGVANALRTYNRSGAGAALASVRKGTRKARAIVIDDELDEGDGSDRDGGKDGDEPSNAAASSGGGLSVGVARPLSAGRIGRKSMRAAAAPTRTGSMSSLPILTAAAVASGEEATVARNPLMGE